ncbi:hypothetical protein SZ25_00461, partial [Candidatus Arcanobacter lacustris]
MIGFKIEEEIKQKKKNEVQYKN